MAFQPYELSTAPPGTSNCTFRTHRPHRRATCTRALPSEQLTRLVEEYPFLDRYRQQLSGLPLARWLAEFEAGYAGHLPLRAVRSG